MKDLASRRHEEGAPRRPLLQPEDPVDPDAQGVAEVPQEIRVDAAVDVAAEELREKKKKKRT